MASKQPFRIPRFRSEAQETEWWRSPAGIRYAEGASERARSEGNYLITRGPLTARDIGRLKALIPKLQPVSIRFARADIEDAKTIAQRQGIGYQTVLKQAVRSGLDAMLRAASARAAHPGPRTKKAAH
jgi:hypothetical protein